VSGWFTIHRFYGFSIFVVRPGDFFGGGQIENQIRFAIAVQPYPDDIVIHVFEPKRLQPRRRQDFRRRRSHAVGHAGALLSFARRNEPAQVGAGRPTTIGLRLDLFSIIAGDDIENRIVALSDDLNRNHQADSPLWILGFGVLPIPPAALKNALRIGPLIGDYRHRYDSRCHQCECSGEYRAAGDVHGVGSLVVAREFFF